MPQAEIGALGLGTPNPNIVGVLTIDFVACKHGQHMGWVRSRSALSPLGEPPEQ